jgi:hypothetical protein
MGEVKLYAILVGVGAAAGIALAEVWRRKVHHDSYLNYLPPVPEREIASENGAPPTGRVRAAVNRVWLPVAESARRERFQMRRIRVGAPKPQAASPDRPVDSPAPAPTTPTEAPAPASPTT